jgi:tryptophan synthase beta chain
MLELARTEGILCALETAHEVHHARSVAQELGKDGVVVINLSGRGDKDTETMAKAFAARRSTVG